MIDIDFSKELGASEEPSSDRLTLYIPNKDCNDNLITNHGDWVKEARTVLTNLGGGATAFPPVDGTWRKPDGKDIWEKTIIIYTFIDPEKFKEHISELRAFLHRFGRETKQGKVIVEFGGMLWGIEQYDKKKE